jgi:hypothetical protein
MFLKQYLFHIFSILKFLEMKKLLLVFACLVALFLPVFAQYTEGGINEKKEVATKVTPIKAQETLPQLPAEWLQKLLDSCTLVDYTFFTMPITISLDRQASVRSSLRHIGAGLVVRKSDCKLFAKLFYQIKGRMILDADMYFSDNGCSYLVYNIGGKPTFANPISTEGVQFLNQIIERQKAKKP